MIYVALRMLTGDRLKHLALVIGLGFAALLVTQQASIFTGYALRTVAWIEDTAVADLWVLEPQIEFSDDIKPIQDNALYRVRGIEGVRWAVPMLKTYVNCQLADGTQMNVRLIGLDDASLTGGPPGFVKGSLEVLREDRAILVNNADLGKSLRLKRATGADADRPLRVGDRMSMNDREAIIAGVYTKTDEFFWEPVLYTTYSRALQYGNPERKQLMYVLVKLDPSADAGVVSADIERTTGLRVLTNQQFAKLTMDYVLDQTGILINFGITILLGVIIGILVSGMLLYSFVLDNVRYFAAIKAMGGSNSTILRMLAAQVLLAGATGFGLGLGGAALTGSLFEQGGLAFKMVWQIPVIGFAAIVGCCAFAGLIAAARVFRVEPAVVFKS